MEGSESLRAQRLLHGVGEIWTSREDEIVVVRFLSEAVIRRLKRFKKKDSTKYL